MHWNYSHIIWGYKSKFQIPIEFRKKVNLWILAAIFILEENKSFYLAGISFKLLSFMDPSAF